MTTPDWCHDDCRTKFIYAFSNNSVKAISLTSTYLRLLIVNISHITFAEIAKNVFCDEQVAFAMVTAVICSMWVTFPCIHCTRHFVWWTRVIITVRKTVFWACNWKKKKIDQTKFLKISPITLHYQAKYISCPQISWLLVTRGPFY